MADEKRETTAAGGTTRSEFLGRGVVILTGLLAGAGVVGCSHEERNTSDAAERFTALRPTDPKLLQYREGQRIETGLTEPRGLFAAADGTVYVVGDQALVTFAADGSHRATAALDGEPQCVAAFSGPGDWVVVAMRDHAIVLGKGGKPVYTWPAMGGNALFTGVALGEKGAWVADSGSRLVHWCSWDGKVMAQFGHKDAGSGYPGLVVPSPHLDVAAMRDRLFVNNPGMHRVEEHAHDGKLVGTWGEATSDIDGFCGCCNPTDIALFPDGRFVTAEKGIPRVKVYSADGKLEEVVAGPEAFASSTMGLDLAAMPDGRVLVLDPKERAIRVFVPKERAA